MSWKISESHLIADGYTYFNPNLDLFRFLEDMWPKSHNLYHTLQPMAMRESSASRYDAQKASQGP